MEHVSTRCSLPPDVCPLHPSLLLSTPSHSSFIVWPSPLGWTLVIVKWVRWYWAWGLSTLIFLPHFILIQTDVGLDCILGEHHPHVCLPQKTHVTSDLLRGYTVSCFIQSRMWDIPNWYLQLPTVKCSTVWNVRDDIKQKNNAAICFAGVHVSILHPFHCWCSCIYIFLLISAVAYCLNDQFFSWRKEVIIIIEEEPLGCW